MLELVVVWEAELVVRLAELMAATLLDDVAGNAEVKVLFIAIEFDNFPDITLEMTDKAGLDAAIGTEIACVTLLEEDGSDGCVKELKVPLEVDIDAGMVLVACGLTPALEEATSLTVAEYGVGFPVPGPVQIETVVVPL